MLTKLLIATICLAALAQGARPNGRGPSQGERPRGERPNIRPGSVPGREEPRGFPTTLPSIMSTNLRDLFDRMQMQQDTGRRLDLPQWQSTLEASTEGWWSSISERLSKRGQTFPEEISTQFQEKIVEVFTQMQNEVTAGNTLDLNHWHEVLAGHAQNSWSSLVESVTPGQPDYTVDRQKPRGDKHRKPGNPRERPNKIPPGRRPPPQRPSETGPRVPDDLPQGMRQQLDGIFEGNERRPMGRGEGRDLPNNLPPRMKQSLKEVFDGLKQEIESGTEVDLDVWKNKTLNVIDGWWERMSLMAKDRKPKTENKPYFEEIPAKWEEQINDLFSKMQAQLDNGTLNVDEWGRQTGRTAQKWWDQFSRRTEGRSPFAGRKHLPDEIPERWTQPIQDIFDRIQTDVDNQTPVELMQYHDEAQQIAETWWHKMISARKEDKGKPSMRPNKVRQELPLEMKEQITSIFRRMREETEGNQWDVDYWRNETLALAQAWWDRFTAMITDSDLSMIPQNWTITLREIFEEIREQVETGNTLDISQWRENVVNASTTWLDLDAKILRRLGYNDKDEKKLLMKLGERIPQHYDHLFDRMELAAADSLPLNLTEWQNEIEELATAFGKRILARKDRPQERPGRPQDRPGRPDRPGKPQDRPERPHGRPERPNGRPEKPSERPERPNGRPERPNGRPERPNGRPERPDGRPERPNGRPERPQGRPERPNERPGTPQQNGRPERPNGRQERPQGRPERPNGQPERPNGRLEGPQGRPERPAGRPERPQERGPGRQDKPMRRKPDFRY